jgi:hypothetical protein
MTEEHPIQVDLGGGRGANIPVELPANSRKSKEKQPPKTKQEKIIDGVAVQRPPSLWKRATGSMVAHEVSESVWQYVVLEVLIPTAKSLIYDMVSQGTERWLYGDLRVRSRADRPSGNINYQRMSGTRRAAPEFSTITSRGRAQHDFNDVILATRGDAMDVLDRMMELVKVYGQATVADFYDLVGITSQFTDNEWGWYDLSRADIRHVRGGYLISLPRTQPID